MEIIKGGFFLDSRGKIQFVNDFHFDGIKRFYIITHPDFNVLRAWQGHKIEEKYFFVLSGSFTFASVKIDNWESPSNDLYVEKYTLNEGSNEILKINSGCANGFKANIASSSVLCFSNLTLEESKEDDYRFPNDYWTF